MRHTRWTQHWVLGIITSAAIPTGGAPAAAADCSNPSRLDPQDRTLCTLDDAITGRRKLPWRYPTPDSLRDDVLARLLALSAARYEEEVEIGLLGKGAKQAAMAAKRGRKPNTALASGTLAAAFQLEPDAPQMVLDFSGGR